VSRRAFLRTAGGAAAATAVGSGAASAQGEQPEFPSQVENGNGGDFLDARGGDEVTVEVGAGSDGLAFSPTKLWIDPGTTVTWEWTGAGGSHNVATVEGEASLESEIQDSEGATYQHEFTEEEAGITHYHCQPHDSVGMHAGVAVGDDVPTTGGGEDEASGVVFVPDGAKALGVASFIAMVATLGIAFFFLRYGGDYTPEE